MSTDESEHTLSDALHDFFATTNKTCISRIDRASVPILGVQDDEIRHERTGVLYRIAGRHFVLTAAHRLRQIVDAGIPLYLSMNTPGVTPLPLVHAKFHGTEEEGLDVAAIALSPETARQVAEHKDFLPHSQIDLNGAETRGPFVFFGYPTPWSGHVVNRDYVRSHGLAFLTLPYAGKPLASAHHDPKVHMLLSFAREAIDSDGRAQELPKPEGISGCGVWQVGDIIGKHLKPRDAESVTLVAIQHRWSAGLDYIRATKIPYALSFVIDNYPEAQAAMKLVYRRR